MTTNNGHRARLRERFLKSGLTGFIDYEVLELLLTLGTPRKDCKQIAKRLISKYKSVDKVLNLSQDELQQTFGIGPTNTIGIRLYNELNKLLTEYRLKNQKSLISTENVVEYLKDKIGNEKKEHFVILCLDTKNNIIYDEVSVGTLNASIVHPREVFSKAILHHANQIIIAHNHPSGDPTPSQSDIDTYRRLAEAGKLIGITLLGSYVVTGINFCKI